MSGNIEYGTDKYGRKTKRRSICSIDGCEKPAYHKGWCGLHYKRMYRHGSPDKPVQVQKPPIEQQTCSLDGCEKPARSRGGDLCGMHYHRRYRHGSVDKTARGSGVGGPIGKYRRVRRPGHPLALKNGSVLEHRAVLYDKIGPGPHPCYRCGKNLLWFVADPVKADPRLIQADHLDDDRSNNDPSNLEPCCHACNVGMGQARRHGALKDSGWWSGRDTQTR